MDTPDIPLLKNWLDNTHVGHYLCGQCDGLHLRALQELEAVVDSRLLIQDYGLLLTTEGLVSDLPEENKGPAGPPMPSPDMY